MLVFINIKSLIYYDFNRF